MTKKAKKSEESDRQKVSPHRKGEPKTLAGIWKGKGFEKIANLDEEIRNLRKELGNQILERHK